MKTIVASALGECVHVAGVHSFLKLAEQNGWRTVFLGPANSIQQVIEAAEKEKADLVGVSYRLTPENGERLLAEFAEQADHLRSRGVKFAFGGTPPVVDRIRHLNFFEAHFDGSERIEEITAYLRGQDISSAQEEDFPQNAIERIQWKSPYPLIRHHFGLPDLEKTLQGIKAIAESKVIDVISLGLIRMPRKTSFIRKGRIFEGAGLVVFPFEQQMTIHACMKPHGAGISL